jgi:hypothetical protein
MFALTLKIPARRQASIGQVYPIFNRRNADARIAAPSRSGPATADTA